MFFRVDLPLAFPVFVSSFFSCFPACPFSGHSSMFLFLVNPFPVVFFWPQSSGGLREGADRNPATPGRNRASAARRRSAGASRHLLRQKRGTPSCERAGEENQCPKWVPKWVCVWLKTRCGGKRQWMVAKSISHHVAPPKKSWLNPLFCGYLHGNHHSRDSEVVQGSRNGSQNGSCVWVRNRSPKWSPGKWKLSMVVQC